MMVGGPVFGRRQQLQAGVSVELHQVAGAYHAVDLQVADAAISRRALSDQIHHLKRFLRT